MFFDPSSAGEDITGSAGRTWKPSRAAATGCGPATDFLTLPDVPRDLSAGALLRWKTDPHLAGMVANHFTYGPLLARDVIAPTGALDAFRQALFVWFRRQTKGVSRLDFSPVLLDADSTDEVLSYTGDGLDKGDDNPLFFALESDNEFVYEMDSVARQLMKAHPLLLRTAMRAIEQAGWRTAFVRTPEWFMSEHANWYWDGEESISDDDAMAFLKDRFGDDEETRANYLPSVVRAELCPAEVAVGVWDKCRWRLLPLLNGAELQRLSLTLKGRARQVCLELLALRRLGRFRRKKCLFGFQYQTHPVYAMCSVVMTGSGHVPDLLDTHFNMESQSGENSTYHGITPFARDAKAIRQQYADWTLALDTLVHLDRLVALVSAPL